MSDNNEQWGTRKVTIIGAGAVGSSFAYAMMQHGAADAIALVDINVEYARGQAEDLAHGRCFTDPVQIAAGSAEDYRDSSVIVMTAGAKQKEGESRLDLLGRNIEIVESVVDDIQAQDSKAVLVVVSNPVDILTYAATRHSGWPRERVLGSGTVLDTARFRHQLSQHCGVDVQNVHAYILGEHGDSEFAAWSMAHVSGLQMHDYCKVCRQCTDWEAEREKIVETVRDAAYHIIDYKGATNWAIGLALTRIVGALLRNQKSVLTLSTLLEGEYGLEDVCLSVPCLVGSGGMERILEGDLFPEEKEKLHSSAKVLQKTWADARR